MCICCHGVTAVPEKGEDWLSKHSGITSSSLLSPQQGLIGRARHVSLSQSHGPLEMTRHLSAVPLMARLAGGEAVFIRTSSGRVEGGGCWRSKEYTRKGEYTRHKRQRQIFSVRQWQDTMGLTCPIVCP